ncbi:putative pentatricopeptide repeat-containing protein At3g23330 [Aristolochia californica]|uniref:putative pentatricopeptide repeat-containing protein At3g23330 n=1 Tax=Aristolochia californica TaxID=171875 RepID=UPI0035D8601D
MGVEVYHHLKAVMKKNYGHAVSLVHGSKTNVGNAIINMYSKCRAIYESDRVFDTMYRSDELLWSTIIGAYEQNGLGFETLRRCREMAVAGFGPTQFHFASYFYVRSSVVDMYAKGLTQHGKADNAIQILNELAKTETDPNKTTFIYLLTACSHVGLLEESMFFFDMLCDNYKMEPESEPYCCLIDVLGRAGKLYDAYKFIAGCLYNVGVLVWRTLLSACWKYKNVSIGEELAQRVMQLEPHAHAFYILLSNLYSEASLWKESLEVRKKMAKIGVTKDPGSSWVIINDQLHKFSIGEFSHPEF